MFENIKQQIDDQIVSLSQPQIRPIIREKAEKNTEFGSKISASCFEGYVFLEWITWDNFNQLGDSKAQV